MLTKKYLSINESEFISSWRQSISHVPQNIYLTDNSIAENIALYTKKNKLIFQELKGLQKWQMSIIL